MEYRMSRVSFASLAAQTERRKVIVKDYGSADESTTGEDSDSDTPSAFHHGKWRLSQMTASAYDILKSIRYMRDGDDNACFTALSSIIDLDFTNEHNVSALLQDDGLELMVNMLEVNNIKCRLRTLQVMKRLTENQKIVTMVVLMGIAPILVARLIDDDKHEVTLTCDVIANIARKRRAARAIRKLGGIPKIVSFLVVKKELLICPEESLNVEEKQIINLATSAGHALWKLSKYSKVKILLEKAGLIPIMSNIILVGRKSLFIPLVGVLCECTSQSLFQLAIETEGLVGRLLCEAQEKDSLVQRMCCRTLMQAANGNANVRHMMRYHKGPRVLARLLASCDPRDKPLLATVLGAIWKNAIAPENVKIFDELGVVRMIVPHLGDYNLDVVQAAAGALAELGQRASCREEMVRKGAVWTLATLLNCSITKLLPNVAHALRQCALDATGVKEIEACDVVRRLWTLLTNYPDLAVRVEAARTLEPCVRHVTDSPEVIRSITNSLLLLVNLLKHHDVDFLQTVCALVAEVALDDENLGVMSEQGVASLLSNILGRKSFEEPKENKDAVKSESGSLEVKFALENDEKQIPSPEDSQTQGSQTKHKVKTEDLLGLYRVASAAIANCCTRADNRQRFGSLGVIPRLVQFMESKDALLQAQACRALHALSFSAANCVTIHSCHAVPHLLCAIGSCNQMMQLGAAGCMYNLRNLLLRAERRGCKKKKGRLRSNTPSQQSSSLHDTLYEDLQ